MNSHEYAEKLKATAERMLEGPDVDMGSGPYIYIYFTNKEKFLAAARAFGSGEKVYRQDEFRFSPSGTCMTLGIARSKVCRKVQEEKWECEPLLSEQEVATL